MKKSNFTLKNLGSEVAILFNGKPLKKISNYKKALKFIALYITHKNIDNFDLFVWEKNKMEKIKNFDPEVMINHSEGKINARKNGQIGFSEFLEEDNDLRDMNGNMNGKDDYENLMRKYRRNQDEDDDFEFDNDEFDRRDFNDFDRRNMNDNFERPRNVWVYRSTDTTQDLENIKKNMKSIFSKL